jgi:hypothetical protein
MHRVANDPSTNIPDRFRSRLLPQLNEFHKICNGVFTDFKLDDLLHSPEDVEDFLSFLNRCVSFVVSNGPVLRQDFLNELVEESDEWNVDLGMKYPLDGLGRLATLVSGAELGIPGDAPH